MMVCPDARMTMPTRGNDEAMRQYRVTVAYQMPDNASRRNRGDEFLMRCIGMCDIMALVNIM
jgi:hypothetical protein